MKRTLMLITVLLFVEAPASKTQKDKATQSAAVAASLAVEHKGDVTDVTVVCRPRNRLPFSEP